MATARKTIFRPSKKSKQVYREFEQAKYTILEGAVRSSKSYTANLIAIKYIQTLPPCDILISGYTITSVARNVISEWKTLIDPYGKGIFRSVKGDKDEYLTINWRGLKDKKFYIRGGGTDADYKQIQGSTFGFWYSDETAQHTESFINMAISRLSLDFSKAIWTLNPDTPYHFIKKRFIDDENKYKIEDDGFRLFQRYHYDLYDNPSLSPRIIQEYEAQYVGIFYNRYILGLWTLAEGIIYDAYNEALHLYDSRDLPPIKRWYVSVDYGTQNACVFLLFGEAWHNVTRHQTYWLEDEFYYSGRDEQRQMTDEQYCDKMEEWLHGTRPVTIYVDPSAASFILSLKQRGYHVVGADNNVADGIRLQAKMLGSGDYKINRRNCPNTKKEYALYSWDDKKAQRTGEDVPIKNHDHTKDAERYFFNTKIGFKQQYKYSEMM